MDSDTICAVLNELEQAITTADEQCWDCTREENVARATLVTDLIGLLREESESFPADLKDRAFGLFRQGVKLWVRLTLARCPCGEHVDRCDFHKLS